MRVGSGWEQCSVETSCDKIPRSGGAAVIAAITTVTNVTNYDTCACGVGRRKQCQKQAVISSVLTAVTMSYVQRGKELRGKEKS